MLRISTNMLFDKGISSMLEQQTKLSNTQDQISSGKRILSPKDDPAGSAYLLDLKSSISKVDQYQDNADRARARLELEETVLASTGNILQRVHELAIQGQNDILTEDQRRDIATEVRLLNDELLSLANTKDSNGEYIFAGYNADQPPFSNPVDGTYAYSGDMGSRQLQIAADRRIQDRDNGFDVFMNLDTSTTPPLPVKRNLFETVHQIATGLEADSPNAALLDDIQIGQVHTTNVRATVGTRLNAIEEQSTVNEDFLLTMKTAQSEVEDLDMAEALSRYQQELLVLQAAQQSFVKLQGLSLFNYL
ncbi:MAG: flagellar hook protein [Gammaproteobacteria bacterium (ex Lamellibrachia satsuma)]|nr:MAG: flagellar hook-associated protein FlgL [Gammaproteobacteria bacterium (ex Lamellibrachia satsuma)]RRS32948.1 MAG: flagellar hook protein [Gammaproteobacteria bacterium (ex Lamellibrachia satsuma)]RRS34059.1 MAG: flagellar hook protein [Gammaproteobacteria bacterium (ex Lamellibrachia satsuma)]